MISINLILLLVVLIIISTMCSCYTNIETFDGTSTLLTYYNEHKLFPFRILCDENRKPLEMVALTAFLRTDEDVKRFNEFKENNIKIIGITAYKSFPRPILDNSADNAMNNYFDYIGNIKNWLCCFKDANYYGFTGANNLIDISESDFYDIDESPPVEKKYDLIYSCLADEKDSCSMDGWNAINRNFKLALACLPILINEYKFKVLILGRMNCGLEEKYGNMIEVLDMLPYHEFQEKLKQSRLLFIPNIFDASPRVICEAITKDVPVLMNKNILCGSKYINQETGEFFIDENDLRVSLNNLLKRKDTMSPKKWWKANYSKSTSGKKLRDFLYPEYKEILEHVKEVHLY